MITILLVVGNEREEQILKLAFGQLGVKVVCGKPGYHNYVKIQQYVPDAVIMEFPHMCMDELHLTQLIRSHKRTKKVPIIGYGNQADEGVIRGIQARGVSNYLVRPLRFTIMLTLLKEHLRRNQKNLDVDKPPMDTDKDVEALLSDTTLPTEKIAIMTAHVSKMLAFPFTVAKVLQLSQDTHTGAADLAHAIEADPVISAHLLRVSNSVFFASSNRRINSIRDSIVRIGFNETKRIVMSMSIMKLLSSQEKGAGFNRLDFWYHSLSSAVIASSLARHAGGINTEEAFLAGLLHDFGILILDEFFPTIFSDALERTSQRECEFICAVEELLKITHNDVVAELFPAWKMPEAITRGVTLQYQYNELDPATPENKIALCVGVANILSKTLKLGCECDLYVKPIDNAVFQTLKLPAGFSDSFIEKCLHDVGLFCHLLELEERKMSFGFATGAKPEHKSVALLNPSRAIFVPPRYYLSQAGFNVTTLTTPAAPGEHDLMFDLLVIWEGDCADTELIHQCAKMVRRYDTPPPDGEELENLPVILFSVAGSKVADNPDRANVSVLAKSGELRLMERMTYSLLFEPSTPLTMGNAVATTPPARPVAGRTPQPAGSTHEDD